MNPAENEVVIRLPHAEAVVLFHCLFRLDESDSLPCEDPAEKRVFWDIQTQLESILVEPLQPNYNELVSRARQAVSKRYFDTDSTGE
jgi:hypothetical protein